MNWLAGISVAFVILIGIVVMVELVAMTVLLLVLKNLLQEIRERVDPLIAKANVLLATANEMAQTLQERSEHIAERTAETNDIISNRMEKTTGLIQHVVADPIIGGIATIEGLRRGYTTWRVLRQLRRAKKQETE